MDLHDRTNFRVVTSPRSDEVDGCGRATLEAVDHPVGAMPHPRRTAMLQSMRRRSEADRPFEKPA
jgi:hypothetical protein